MSNPTYTANVKLTDKPLVWLHGAVRSPPFSAAARLEAGFLLRRLQGGDSLGLPHSRPMPTIGPGCHELRINDERGSWRIIYRIERDAVLILEVFEKKTTATPKTVIENCKTRLQRYRNDTR